MKPQRPSRGDGLLNAAVIQTMMDARWKATDLLRLHPQRAASQLLRGEAAEIVRSAKGRDQLMSLALAAAADDLERGGEPLESGAMFFPAPEDPAERVNIQRQVLAASDADDPAADELVGRVEAEHRGEVSGGGAFAEVAERLLRDARLHKLLWDDPRIKASAPTRLTMLRSVPRLADRARTLDPLHLRAVRALIKRPARAGGGTA